MSTLEELERRVEQLEDQVEHALPAKIDAVAYLLSVVHEETRAIRQVLDGHGQMLEEILRRLPRPEA
ncbi:MAG TPA: hypothetical protein VIK57_23040 [Streptosporangiaceae bacterium]|jgi:hypothetical protein